MKYYPVAHGSPEWFECRRGIPTTSCFDKIITPTGKLSAQSDDYMDLLLAEIITGEVLHKFPQSYWMERGAFMEAEAAAYYEFETGYKLERGGFITDDQTRFGASPDRLVLDKDGKVIGGLEIKCPAPWTHVRNLRHNKIDKKYMPQVQGQNYIGEFQFVDWMSYYPGMQPSLIKVERDEDYIANLEAALIGFNDKLRIEIDKFIEREIIDKAFIKNMPDIAKEDFFDSFLSNDEELNWV